MLPNFFIPGAPRCGTTSLDAILRQHPDILMSDPKEPNIFGKQWDRGGGIQHRCYSAHSGQKAIGDATPYYLGTGGVVVRIQSEVPHARFIVCLREPVARTVSHFDFRRANGLELRRFGDVLKAGRAADVIRHSCYGANLAEFMECFSRERFTFVELEDLAKRPSETVAGVLGFLEVEPLELAASHVNESRPPGGGVSATILRGAQRTGVGRVMPAGVKRRVRRVIRRVNRLQREGDKTVLTPAEREQLVEIFDPEVRQLEDLTGLEFDRWRQTWT